MPVDATNCANDPYFYLQWGLKNTGQNGGTIGIDLKFCTAKEITQGNSNIIVAVVDHGIDLNHPDLNLYHKSYDTETNSSPSQIWGEHGTACAGIIGAKNNSIGVAGIAPECKLMSISNKLRISPDYCQKIANGINYAWKNGASIISNSYWAPSETIISDAIEEALTKGRNGLGTVIVFAAGNENSSIVSFPANSHPDIITVGAISPCGERKSYATCDGESWWGSNYGNNLDVMAPGVLIPTTDIRGYDGYAPGDYITSFNGTSSACPHVAGVAALILSINSNLTQKQVGDIIEGTAQKVGNYNYTVNANRPNGLWNNQMGYGLVDAYAAVSSAAINSTVYFTNKTVSVNETVSGSKIIAEDVIVNNRAKLTFRSPVVEINNFIVNATCDFEIQLN